jgi:hypothetical protein
MLHLRLPLLARGQVVAGHDDVDRVHDRVLNVDVVEHNVLDKSHLRGAEFDSDASEGSLDGAIRIPAPAS